MFRCGSGVRAKLFGRGTGDASAPIDSSRSGQGDAIRHASAATTPLPTPPIPRLLALDAAGHAAELLSYLQGPGGRTGTITARELADVHMEMCSALEIEPIGWIAVGRELRRLLKQSKLYIDREGRRTRAFRIPPGPIECQPAGPRGGVG